MTKRHFQNGCGLVEQAARLATQVHGQLACKYTALRSLSLQTQSLDDLCSH